MNWKNQNTTSHAEKIKNLVDGLLDGQGDSEPLLRRSVEARAAFLSGRTSGQKVDLPQELMIYVDKIAEHAYKVTDDDIETLYKAGYSEDAVFELTLSAALGAGIARLECGMAALKAEK